MNRLSKEKSPYLLQHAHNPVDWYPWGEEAFARARAEDKPVLLSIGYSTCHWCHVMERECFEDPRIAALMNEHFVCIKLDREERPDVDRIYMTAVQALTGQGGWPLNVFLTPDLEPFLGGTYFPPEDRWGRPGWPRIVESLGMAWRDPDKRRDLLDRGKRLTEGLRAHMSPGESGDAPGPEGLFAVFESLADSFDPAAGGFSGAPKFPMPVYQHFLFRFAHWARRNGRAGEADRAEAMALATLRSMARGGIFDLVGGGFHRYSTDARWHVPHFEKMLYDNAQLALNFLEAWQIAGDPDLEKTARQTLDYLLRDMAHPEGAFHSAEDADSLPTAGSREKREGAFYAWGWEEFQAVVGGEAGLLAYLCGLEPGGNVREDPQGEFGRANVLFRAHTPNEAAAKFQMTAEEVQRRAEAGRARLKEARDRRPRPHRDDKVLTAWNGLALSALARAGAAFEEERYVNAARRAAAFLRRELWDGRRLFRRWREGERAVEGMADDHIFLVQGLLDLFEAEFDPGVLFWAEELGDLFMKGFVGKEGHVYSSSGKDARLLLRAVEEGDNVEPSAASVAVSALGRLARLLARPDLDRAAELILKAHAGSLRQEPRRFPALAGALVERLSPPMEIVVAGSPGDSRTREFLRTARRFSPARILVLADGGVRQRVLEARLPYLKGVHPGPKGPRAYVCRHFACELPIEDRDSLAERLL